MRYPFLTWTSIVYSTVYYTKYNYSEITYVQKLMDSLPSPPPLTSREKTRYLKYADMSSYVLICQMSSYAESHLYLKKGTNTFLRGHFHDVHRAQACT
jgi:hypothetical protein